MPVFIDLHTDKGSVTFNLNAIKTITFGVDGMTRIWLGDVIFFDIPKEQRGTLLEAIRPYLSRPIAANTPSS